MYIQNVHKCFECCIKFNIFCFEYFIEFNIANITYNLCIVVKTFEENNRK